ncbi:NUDIX domain-containing protein [Streptomyces albus]
MSAGSVRVGVSAGAVLTDERGHILLVKPGYKAGWNLPGGHVDEGETPHAACVREIREELGITPDISPEPLVTAWMAPTDGPPRLNFVFDGGQLSGRQREAVRLPADELTDWRFFPLEADDPALIPPRIRALLAAVRTSRRTGRPVYREAVL